MSKITSSDSIAIGIQARQLNFKSARQRQQHWLNEKIAKVKNNPSIQGGKRAPQRVTLRPIQAVSCMAAIMMIAQVASGVTRRSHTLSSQPGRKHRPIMLPAGNNPSAPRTATQRSDLTHVARCKTPCHRSNNITNKAVATPRVSRKMPNYARGIIRSKRNYYMAGQNKGFGFNRQRTDKNIPRSDAIPPITYDQDSLYTLPLAASRHINVTTPCQLSSSKTTGTGPLTGNNPLEDDTQENGTAMDIWDITTLDLGEQIMEYYLLANKTENIRLLGLNALWVGHQKIDSQSVLDAYLKMFKIETVDNRLTFELDPYEVEILLKTLLNEPLFEYSRHQLLSRIRALFNIQQWLGALFVTALNALDQELIHRAIMAFNLSLTRETKISHLKILQQRELQKFDDLHAGVIPNDTAFRQLTSLQLFALKHLFNSTLQASFPMVDFAAHSGVQGIRNNQVDIFENFRIFSPEGFLLNYGAACATTFGLKSSIYQQPQLLQYIAIRTLLDVTPEHWPALTTPLFLKYFENYPDEIEDTITSSFKPTVLGYILLMSDLVSSYTKSYELVNAFSEFSDDVNLLTRENYSAEKLDEITQKLNDRVIEYCLYNLLSLSRVERKNIEIAINEVDSTVKISKLKLNRGVGEGNKPIIVGSLLTIQNADDIITQAYLLSPSIISTYLISPGIIRIPHAVYTAHSPQQMVTQQQNYFMNIFTSMNDASKERAHSNFTLTESQTLHTEQSAEDIWISHVANFTVGDLKGIKAAGGKLSEAFTAPDQNLTPHHFSQLKEVIISLASFIPFSSCIWAAIDVTELTKLAAHANLTSNAGKETSVDLGLNSLGCAADFVNLGSTTAFKDMVKAIGNIRNGFIRKLFASAGGKHGAEAASGKAAKTDKVIPLDELKHHSVFSRYIDKAAKHKPQFLEAIALNNLPENHRYFGTLYNSPDASLTIVFSVDGRQKMYAYDKQSQRFMRKSARYEHEHQGESIINANIALKFERFTTEPTYFSQYYQSVLEEVQLQRLEGYGFTLSEFETLYPGYAPLKDRPNVYGKNEADPLFLEHGEVYLRMLKAADHGVLKVVAENAPVDLHLDTVFDSQGQLHIVDNYLSKLTSSELAVENAVRQYRNHPPLFPGDIILARISPPAGNNLRVNGVALANYHHANQVVVALKDSAGLHYRLGPDERGDFVPLPDEGNEGGNFPCRTLRAIDSGVAGCSHWHSPAASLSTEKAQRLEDLTTLHKAKLDYMNRVPASWDVMTALQRLDRLEQDPVKLGMVNHYCEERGIIDAVKYDFEYVKDRLNLLSTLDVGRFHDNFEGLTSQALTDIATLWREASYRFRNEGKSAESSLANEMAEIADALSQAKTKASAEQYHDYFSLKSDYWKKYKRAEKNIADALWKGQVAKGRKSTSLLKSTPFLTFKNHEEKLFYSPEEQWFGKSYGLASTRHFKNKYPVQSAFVSDAVKQVNLIAQKFSARASSFWNDFFQFSHIDPTRLSQSTKDYVLKKFNKVSKAALRLNDKNIVPFEEVSRKAIPLSLGNAFQKEALVFDSNLFGFAADGDAKIYFGVNAFNAGENLFNTAIHETAHGHGGKKLGSVEIYFRDGEHFLSSSRPDSPVKRGEILAGSERAFNYFITRDSRCFRAFVHKLKGSLEEEMSDITQLISQLEVRTTSINIFSKNSRTLTTLEEETLGTLTRRGKVIRELLNRIELAPTVFHYVDNVSKKLGQTLTRFLFALGNEEHRVNVLVMNPDFFSAFMQFVAFAPLRVARQAKNATTVAAGHLQGLTENESTRLASEIVSHLGGFLLNESHDICRPKNNASQFMIRLFPAGWKIYN